jgi:peroxiredoxin
VFANGQPKVVVASRRENERHAVVRGTENRSGKGLFVKTRAARKADMKTLMDKTLVKVGDSAPDFILPDTGGNAVRLYSLLRAGHVVVVFYRGSWCPYCDLHLRGFQQRLAELRELGAQVVAISPDLADDLLSAQIKSQLALPLLSDEGDKVIRQFGLVVEGNNDLLELYRLFGHRLEYPNGHGGKKDLPVAGTFLISNNGTIRLAHVDVDHTCRLDVDDIVDALSELTTIGFRSCKPFSVSSPGEDPIRPSCRR